MTRRGGPGAVLAFVTACRPRQWVKNALVLVAPVVAGVVTHGPEMRATAVALVAFVAASAGVYLVNDIADVERDRAHPTKRRRPIASGAVSVPVARAGAAVLLVGAVLGALTVRVALAEVVAIYVVSVLSYSFWLKNEPVIELVLLASGFLLRAIAGGVAADVPLSPWFLIATGFGSLFVAAGKRYAEVQLVDSGAVQADAGAIRPVLRAYTATYLRFVWTMSAAVLVLTYSLWAFSMATDTEQTTSIISIVPFVVAILRYAVDIDRGSAGEPEEIVAKDRALLVTGLVWAALVFASVYL